MDNKYYKLATYAPELCTAGVINSSHSYYSQP